MSTPSQSAEPSPQDLTHLSETCLELAEKAETVLASCSLESDSFLASSLADALQQLDLVLSAIERDDEEADGGQGFLKRFTQVLKGGPKREGKASDPDYPNLSTPQQGLHGNSWTISLPELLGFLASARKTGLLWVDSHHENFLIGLEQGNLVHATSSSTPEGLRLGEILVGLGYLTRRQLERFLAAQQVEGIEFSGESLLETGMISDDELNSALCHQAQQMFHRLLDIDQALFRFQDGMQVTQTYQVSQNVTKLLLESARVRDEMGENQTLRHLVGMSGGVEPTPVSADEWSSFKDEVLSEISREVSAEDKRPLSPSSDVKSTKPATSDESKPAKAPDPKPALPGVEGDKTAEANDGKVSGGAQSNASPPKDSKGKSD